MTDCLSLNKTQPGPGNISKCFYSWKSCYILAWPSVSTPYHFRLAINLVPGSIFEPQQRQTFLDKCDTFYLCTKCIVYFY